MKRTARQSNTRTLAINTARKGPRFICLRLIYVHEILIHLNKPRFDLGDYFFIPSNAQIRKYMMVNHIVLHTEVKQLRTSCSSRGSCYGRK